MPHSKRARVSFEMQIRSRHDLTTLCMHDRSAYRTQMGSLGFVFTLASHPCPSTVSLFVHMRPA